MAKAPTIDACKAAAGLYMLVRVRRVRELRFRVAVACWLLQLVRLLVGVADLTVEEVEPEPYVATD